VIDGPESWSQTMEAEGIIEKFIGVDFSDADTVFQQCLTAIKKAQASFGELDGICTFCEMAVPLATRLAEKLGLPGNTPAAVDAARDKYATRTKLQEAGLPNPKNYLISEPQHVKEAATHVGFPAVIKPIYGAASIGVVRVDNLEQLEKTYIRVQEEMAGAKIVDGALVQGDNPNQGGKAGGWIQTTLMLEEYLDGPEVDVDLIFSEGEAVYGCLTDNWPTVEPYFNETGSNCPSILPPDQQKALIDLAVRSTQALGFTQGVFHVECKYTSRGARLIEVNCRMGGGPVRNINLLVWGVDMVEEHLLTTAGIPVRPPVASKPLKNIAEFSSNAKKTGTVQNDDFCKKWENHPDVLYCRPIVGKGEKVTAVTDGMPTWVAEMMVKKPSVQEAIDFVKEIEEGLQIQIA